MAEIIKEAIESHEPDTVVKRVVPAMPGIRDVLLAEREESTLEPFGLNRPESRMANKLKTRCFSRSYLKPSAFSSHLSVPTLILHSPP